jgi:hypothetical protein
MAQRTALWALAAVLAVTTVVLVAKIVQRPAPEPPALPLAAITPDGDGAGTAGNVGTTGNGTTGTGQPGEVIPTTSAGIGSLPLGLYAPADDLPVLGGDAPAFGLGGAPTRAEVRRLAAALGIDGEPTSSAGSWHVEGGEMAVDVDGAAGSWSAQRLAAGQGATTPEDPFEAVTPDPTADEAESIARDLAAAVGVSVAGADVQVENQLTQWLVTVEPTVAGLPSPGLALTVAVGSGGRIESAAGTLGHPVDLGDYPLVDTPAALGRINNGWLLTDGTSARLAAGQRTDSVPATTVPPPEIPVTEAELVLIGVASWDGSGGYLVPGYRFTADDGSRPAVPAVSDHVLALEAQPAPADEPGEDQPTEPAPVSTEQEEGL